MALIKQFKSRIVNVGQLRLGGDEPVRIQSMTNTSTMDVESTYRQITALYEAGCEMVRMTSRNMAEAEKLGLIRNMLERSGIYIPLVADIHFNPRVAELAAGIVHKVRINPGNYLDQQYYLGKEGNSSGSAYSNDERRESILRLVNICRKNNTVIRVGVNHGSLSKRILHKYGNTPEGMVASAMEFLEICQQEGFHDLLVSMKSSHVKTMIKATIGITGAMMEQGMDYPLHLGVTEAGEGQDGRIRSAAGIGPLLERGLGDTIRVSLTEDPIAEIPVAKKLVKMYEGSRERVSIPTGPISKAARKVASYGVFGNNMPPVVVGDSFSTGQEEQQPDLVAVDNTNLIDQEGNKYSAMEIGNDGEFDTAIASREELVNTIIFNAPVQETEHIREMFNKLGKQILQTPLIIKFNYVDEDMETFTLKASADIACLIFDGIGEGFWINNETVGQEEVSKIIFGILQATGARISGTEYISCPTCGRTNFDMQAALKQVKEHTSGMKNVKIAVMGCIVNGPGEMADADYGYVGEGKGKVSLYQHGKRIKKGIDEKDALAELLKLIRESGN